MEIEILNRDDLKLGGFAGLKEHRIVMDPKAFGANVNPGTWPGIGNFVYLADARFDPNGETEMHRHQEIDVISVMVDGRISHEGSLEHGKEIKAFDVQAQRAGGEGFSHNEINPDETVNRMVQLWVLPETSGQPANYKTYNLRWGKMTPVYGGSLEQNETFDSHTIIKVGLMLESQKLKLQNNFLAYLAWGKGIVNGQFVVEGTLFRGDQLDFEAKENSQLIIVHTSKN
jgi:quercetin 2,3-dioxygenase